MPDTNYAEPPAMPDKAGEEGESQDDPVSETVLVDKSVFGDDMPEPGEKVTFTFVRSYEDEVELKLDDGDSSMGDDSGTAESADRAIGEMAA